MSCRNREPAQNLRCVDTAHHYYDTTLGGITWTLTKAAGYTDYSVRPPRPLAASYLEYAGFLVLARL